MAGKRCIICSRKAAFSVYPIVATVGRSPRKTATGSGIAVCDIHVDNLDNKAMLRLAASASHTKAKIERIYAAQVSHAVEQAA